MQKPLFALAALLATALLVALAWGLTLLLSGAIHLPKWAAIVVLVLVLAGLQLMRWRRKRSGY